MNATNTGTPNFTTIFDKITTVIEFKTEWKNGTGYMDSLVDEDLQGHLLGYKNVNTVKTVDDYGRRVIVVIAKNERNVVLFERYSKEGAVIVSNMPHGFEERLGSRYWNDANIVDAFSKILIQCCEMVEAAEAAAA